MLQTVRGVTTLISKPLCHDDWLPSQQAAAPSAGRSCSAMDGDVIRVGVWTTAAQLSVFIFLLPFDPEESRMREVRLIPVAACSVCGRWGQKEALVGTQRASNLFWKRQVSRFAAGTASSVGSGSSPADVQGFDPTAEKPVANPLSVFRNSGGHPAFREPELAAPLRRSDQSAARFACH